MARMPSLRRPAVRVLLIAALAATGAVAYYATALAAFPALDVTIVTPKGKQLYPDTTRLDPGTATDWDIRDRNGERPRLNDVEPVYLPDIFKLVRRELGYGTVEITRRDGSTLRIGKDDVDGYPQPFLYQRGDKFYFFRPSQGPTDYNARDHFELNGVGVIFTQTPVEPKVKLTADDRTIEPGGSVHFDVKVTGGSPGAKYQFNWIVYGADEFPDPTTKPELDHVFETRRKEPYKVAVTAENLETGKRTPSNAVSIQVGDPDQKPAEDDGQQGTGTGTGTGSGSTYDSGTSSTYEPSTPSVPSTPSTDPPLIPDIATSDPTVSGNLLADVNDPPASSILESAAEAARKGEPKDEEIKGAGVPEAAVAIAAVLALIGLGAGLELRLGRSRRAA
jgi:hypothetical protein